MRATVAPFLFLPLLFSAGTAAAQRTELFGAVGGAASTDVLRDEVASPALRQLLGAGVDRSVSARPGVGVVIGGGVRVPVRGRTVLEVEGSWSPVELRAHEDGRVRTIQDVHVVQALASVGWRVRERLELGAGAGITAYMAEERGMFAEGSGVGPALRAHAGVRLPFWSERVTAHGSAQLHRFGTPAIRRGRGTDGVVRRYEVGVRVRLLELGR